MRSAKPGNQRSWPHSAGGMRVAASTEAGRKGIQGKGRWTQSGKTAVPGQAAGAGRCFPVVQNRDQSLIVLLPNTAPVMPVALGLPTGPLPSCGEPSRMPSMSTAPGWRSPPAQAPAPMPNQHSPGCRAAPQQRISVRGAHPQQSIDLDIPATSSRLSACRDAKRPGWTRCAPRRPAAGEPERLCPPVSPPMDKPDVDLIEWPEPAISIDRASATSPTHAPPLGTVTEIHDTCACCMPGAPARRICPSSTASRWPP